MTELDDVSDEPTREVSTDPTDEPTREVSTDPTDEPTREVSTDPTDEPTREVSTDPTDEPTREVSTDPTDEPTREVSTDPTEDEILEYDGEAATADSGAEEAYRTRPTIKPVLIWIGIAVVLGGGLAALLNAVPELLGDPQLAAVAVWVVVLVTALVVVRLLARTYVLLRTRYVIDDSTIRSEFHLLYKSRTRQLPFDRVRGFDVEQDRLQSALGIGTVSTLSGGTNHSLGFVEFEHVPKPESVGERIREGIDET